jgi:hypothetical protein
LFSEVKFANHQVCTYCLSVKYATKDIDSTLLIACSGSTLASNPKKHRHKHPDEMANAGSRYVCTVSDLSNALKFHNEGVLTYTNSDSSLNRLLKLKRKGK